MKMSTGGTCCARRKAASPASASGVWLLVRASTTIDSSV